MYSKQWETVLSQHMEKGLVMWKKSKGVNTTTALDHWGSKSGVGLCTAL